MIKNIVTIFILLLTLNLIADTNADKIFSTAVNYFDSQNYKLAEKYFDRYLFAYPEDKNRLKSYEYLIKISLINKEYLDAIKYLNIILKTFPEQIDIALFYRKLADIYFRIGKYEKALQYYNYILIKFPDSPETESAQYKIEQITSLTTEKD